MNKKLSNKYLNFKIIKPAEGAIIFSIILAFY